jgi:hypothetical protein
MLVEDPVFGMSPAGSRFFSGTSACHLSPSNPLTAVAPGSLTGRGARRAGGAPGCLLPSTALLSSSITMGTSPALVGSWGAALAALGGGGSAAAGSLGGLLGALPGGGPGGASPVVAALLGEPRPGGGVGSLGGDAFMRFSGESNLMMMDMEVGGFSPGTAGLYDEIMKIDPTASGRQR